MPANNDRPKVMHIDFYGQINDTKAGLSKVILTFAKHCHSVEHISAGLGKKNCRHYHEKIECIDFVEDKIKNKVLNKVLRLSSFTYSSLIRIIESERPDILHFHTRPELVDTVYERISVKPKVIFHYHRHYINPSVPQCATMLIAISNGVKQSVIRASNTEKHIEVLLNPLPHGIPNIGTAPLTHPKIPTIFYSGGTNANKGIYELIDACSHLDKKGIPFKLWLAGPATESLAPPLNNTEVLGYLAQNKYYRYLQESDIFVMPSKREGFGLAMLEAFYFAKIGIGTNTPGLNEILATDHAVKFKSSDSTSIAEVLESVLEKWQRSPAQFDDMRTNAHQFSLNLHPEIVGKRLSAIYQQIINKT